MGTADSRLAKVASRSSAAMWLALLLCLPAPGAKARINAHFQAASVPPGAPAVTSSAQQAAQGQGSYGWLSPVLASTRRGSCVVHQARGRESLQDVARLFGLTAARVLADNQGVITDAQHALGGRSILLCGQHGQPPPKPVRPAAAAGPDAAAEEGGLHVSRMARQVAPAPSRVSKREEKALLQLKAVLDPQNQVLRDWGPTLVAPESRVPVTSHCTWTYVSCNANGSVVRLNLVYIGLEGSLPSGTLLSKLPQLTELYLGGNLLQGTLPADWANNTRLTHLYLNDNQLTGRLPGQWGSMKTLRVLSLPQNEFSGPLPASWSHLDSLEDLKLNNNQLSGRVPSSYGGMASLSAITLWNNPNLTGCLPVAWADKSSRGKGFFQSPAGVLTGDVKGATMETGITGFCSASGSRAASGAPKPANAAATASANESAPPAAPSPGSPPAQSVQQVVVQGGAAKPPSAAMDANAAVAATNSTTARKAAPQRDMRPRGKH